MEGGSVGGSLNKGSEAQNFLDLRKLGVAETPATQVDVLTETINRTALRAIAGARKADLRSNTVRKL